MASPSESSVLPSWEQLLGRLHISEPKRPLHQQELAILQLVTETKEAIRPLLGKLALLLSRLEPIKCAIIIQGTPMGPSIIASTISRKRAASILLSQSVQKQLHGRHISQKSPLVRDEWLAERFGSICVSPLGRRVDDHSLVLLSTAAIPTHQLAFVRLVSRIVILRLANHRLEEQRRRETESLASLTHHLSEGMAMTDNRLTVSLWNRPLQRLTGFSPPEAIGKPIDAVVRNTTNPNWFSEKLAFLTENQLVNLFNEEFEILTKTDARRWAEVSGSVLRDKDQSITQLLIIVRDVTEQHLLELRKNEFISIATHELRTPITAIKGYLSLLEKDHRSLSEKQQAYLQRATAANNRLVRLAEDLLLSVQVEEDRLRLNLRPVNLAVVLSKVTRDLSAKAAAKDLSLHYASPDFITWIVGDEDKVHQIFENLIDNAIKYTVSGSIEVWFERREAQGQPVIITHVRDTGIGISSKNFTAIFEKFHRTHNTAQIRESGAGLGLFIVKSFVEKLGGKITVSSRIGKGTTFSVRFNASEEMENGTGQETKAKKQS
jgi:PAS domain S-box-containing protein